MDFSLSRITEVAKKLKINQINSKVFTVAGTNGKGSTVAILESILVESGYNVGSYTSPHIIEFNERIKINKTPVKTKEICEAFEIIEEFRGNITLTFFEFSTLTALIIFIKYNLDVVILEVGLGGRLDAVNIIDPDVSIITNIGLDHTSILGSDTEKIAYEKSGIMRKNKPTIVGYSKTHLSVIKNSEVIGSNLNIINRDFFYKIKSNDEWNFSNNDNVKINCIIPAIKGKIQIINAATAIQAIYRCDGISFNKNDIKNGIKKSNLIGRFQVIEGKPVTILDIAHNEQSICILAENLKKYYPKNNLHAVFSVLKDKDIDQMLRHLKNVFQTWHISNCNNERALSVKDLGKNCFFITENLNVYDSIEEAYNGAIRNINDNDIVVVFGSSFTVAPILIK